MQGGMKLRLGDLDVTRVGLGTNRLTDSPERVEFVRQAVAAGIDFIDTAHTYSGGRSEAALGAALSPRPAGCVIATKGGWGSGRPNAIRGEIDESLRRLRSETLDLYYLHRVDPDVPLEESLLPIKEGRDAGKIRHAGVSNVGVEQIERARRVVPVTAVQNQYSVTERKHDDVVDYCAREGIVFVAYFPLRGVQGAALSEIAARHGATVAQIALAWLLRRSPVVLPIPGTLSLEHAKENLAAADIELSEADFQALRAAR
jgi:pyridoxine 4-dehydrogenase